jgi:squalene-associated FAD-dependent desaturase
MTFSRDAVETSYRYCRQVTQRAGSSFHAGFMLLPREKRRAMEALYAFMRHTDDLADDPAVGSRRDALVQWRTALQEALRGEGREERGEGRGERGEENDKRETLNDKLAVRHSPPSPFSHLSSPFSFPPSFPALADTVRRFHIPPNHLFAVIDGVEMDLEPRRYETFDDLQQYCERVASAVGLACIHIWGFRGPEAFEPARQAGIALQLTNILRDLKEDATAGRVYLPLADLRACDYSEDDLRAGLVDQRFGQLMAGQIDRAERFYSVGMELIELLDPSGRRIFGLMMASYHALLQKIARHPAKVFCGPVRLSKLKKIQLAARWMLLPTIGQRGREKGEGGRSGQWPVASGPWTEDHQITKSPNLQISPPPSPFSLPPSLAIIGGGLAGLAAAAAAVERGFRVELFEQAGTLGGRAGSFVDSTTGERIDYCQHVAMGCCTALLDFCRHTGIDECFERTSSLHFIAPDGRRYDFAPSRWLPAPLHLLPGLMKLKYLSLGERWGIVRALGQLVRRKRVFSLTAREETIGAWLRRHGQSERAIEQFWSVVLVSALGETVDRASLVAARKVFLDGFLASRGASDLVLPRMPLGEIFHDRLSRWLTDRGVMVHLDTPVSRIEGDQRGICVVVLRDGTRCKFDAVVAAVPWHNVRSLFDENLWAAMPELNDVDRIEPAAITAVHLWFDRPILPLPHAVLVGRLGQWVFSKKSTNPGEHYDQVVISASHQLPERKHDVLVAEVCRELQAMDPEQRPQPRLLHARVITQPKAVFSVQPGMEHFRPDQKTAIHNLFLAGDWTDTGWPATMEGAVRSGYRAIEALHRQNLKSQI